MAVIIYKCPNCGAEIKFDPESQKGKCDFCCINEYYLLCRYVQSSLSGEYIKNSFCQ